MNNQIYDLVYYCDSYPAIGNGHLSRAINILNTFYYRNKQKNLKIGITGKFSKPAINYKTMFLNKHVHRLDNLSHVMSKLIIIDTMFDPLDENYIDYDFCDKIKMKSEMLVLILGVLGKVQLPNSIDIIINHIPDVKIEGNTTCKKFIGFNYAPVTEEFVNDSNINEGKNMLIVIGGNNKQSGPEDILQLLQSAKLVDITIDMVVSPHYPKDQISTLLDFDGLNKINIFQNVKSLIPLFKKSSIIICTYGNIVYESLTYHLPTYVCSYKKFQNEYASYLEKQDLVVNLGLFNDIDFKKLPLLTSKAQKDTLYQNSKTHFNQAGLTNIVKVLEKYV